jgi:putative toxin-antitoxin system antitoxin component (TIGR02293 family)
LKAELPGGYKVAEKSVKEISPRGAKRVSSRSAKRSTSKSVIQAREFTPEKAGSVLQKWYRGEGGRTPRASEALGVELRLADRIASGFPTTAVDDVIGSGLVEASVIYEIVVPRRTLADRKLKQKPLSPEQSDRLVRVLRIYARAEEAIGDVSRAYRWLHRANRALEGMRPIDLLGSDAGTRAVEKVLGRIEHGVVS